jgi:hypothetical protein
VKEIEVFEIADETPLSADAGKRVNGVEQMLETQADVSSHGIRPVGQAATSEKPGDDEGGVVSATMKFDRHRLKRHAPIRNPQSHLTGQL